MEVETRYADSDGVSIAYRVHGEGPLDLVLVPGFVSQVELLWEEPEVARFFRRLTSFSRMLVFDKRGQGLSDRPGRPPTLEESMDDLKAAVEAAGFERPALFGISEGGPMSALYAATYPGEISELVLFGTFARMLKAPDFPPGITEEALDRWGAMIRRDWGKAVGLNLWAPSRVGDREFERWWARLRRPLRRAAGRGPPAFHGRRRCAAGRGRRVPRRQPRRAGVRTGAGDDPLHRHRRLDREGRGIGRPRLARPARAPRRRGPAPAHPPPRPRGEDDGGRLPRHLRRTGAGDPLRLRPPGRSRRPRHRGPGRDPHRRGRADRRRRRWNGGQHRRPHRRPRRRRRGARLQHRPRARRRLRPRVRGAWGGEAQGRAGRVASLRDRLAAGLTRLCALRRLRNRQ